MKRKETDKSAPYRTLGLGKVEKPTKAKCEPRTTKITAKDDLRSGKKK